MLRIRVRAYAYSYGAGTTGQRQMAPVQMKMIHRVIDMDTAEQEHASTNTIEATLSWHCSSRDKPFVAF